MRSKKKIFNCFHYFFARETLYNSSVINLLLRLKQLKDWRLTYSFGRQSKKMSNPDGFYRREVSVKSALKGSPSIHTYGTIIPKVSKSHSSLSKGHLNDDTFTQIPKPAKSRSYRRSRDESDSDSENNEDDSSYDSDGSDVSELVNVEELRSSEADVYDVLRRKSRHKVKRDVYDLNSEIVKLLSSYTKHKNYPPPEVTLFISRLQQYELVTQELVDVKIMQSEDASSSSSSNSSGSSIVGTGPRGGTFKIDSNGRRKYVS